MSTPDTPTPAPADASATDAPAIQAPVAAPLSSSRLLIRMSPRHAMLTTALFSSMYLRLSLADQEWAMRWMPVRPQENMAMLRLRIGSASVSVLLEMNGMFPMAEQLARSPMPADLRNACLQEMGALAWQQIQSMAGAAVEVTDFLPDHQPNSMDDFVSFVLVNVRGDFQMAGFARPDNEMGRRLLESWPSLMGTMPPSSNLPQIPLQLSATLGSTLLTVGEVAELERGDVVLIDNAQYTDGDRTYRLGVGLPPMLFGQLKLDRGRLVMLSIQSKGEFKMENNSQPDDEDFVIRRGGLDEVLVEVRFEVARWVATVADLRSYQPGMVLDLGSPVDGQTVTVWSGRTCIGSGRLMAVGDHLGVQLLSVQSSAAKPDDDEQKPPAPTVVTLGEGG